LRALAALAVLILVMLISITGKETFNPSKWHSQFKVGLGLDLSNGTQVVLKAATTQGTPSAGAMSQAISVLESRVNGTGNSGAQVQQQGADLINVTVPGKPAQSVIDLVSSTAKLSFRQPLLEAPYTGKTTTPAATPSATPSSRPAAHPSPTATGASSPTPGSSPSARAAGSAKASTAALSARLASPSATASASPKASTSAKACLLMFSR